MLQLDPLNLEEALTGEYAGIMAPRCWSFIPPRRLQTL